MISLKKTRIGITMVAILASAAMIFGVFGCSSPRTDMRTLVPADSLVYLETDDLGRLLKGLQENRPFAQAMKSKTDFSVLDGLQFAVAVTGFDASENAITDENSVLNFKPRFVAVGDTHTWDRYTLRFVEETLGNFINEKFGGEVVLERTDRQNGKHFVWTATDGRKVFAFVAASRIFFSNDEAALEKCLAVARGEGENLTRNESLGRLRAEAPAAIASGYVSEAGISQLSNIVGVTTAVEATDDEDGRGFIARVFPEFVRNTVREATWTAAKTETGIEDRFVLELKNESAAVFRETVRPGASESALADFVPQEPFAATRYSLDNPQIAWRSVLLVAGKNTDPASGNIIAAFAGSVLDPYGVSDAETFLSAVGSEIWTVALDSDGDRSAAIVSVKDPEKVRRSIGSINFGSPAEIRDGAEIRRSEDGDLAAIMIDGRLIIGDPEAALKCLEARTAGQSFAKNAAFARFRGNTAPAVTFGREPTDRTVDLLGQKKEENLQFLTNYFVETRFSDRGIDRRTTSPFGLVGRILEQLGEK